AVRRFLSKRYATRELERRRAYECADCQDPAAARQHPFAWISVSNIRRPLCKPELPTADPRAAGRDAPPGGESEPAMRRRLALALPLLLASAALAAPARAFTSEVAALQVALHVRGLYSGTIDGVAGPATKRAVRVFQRRAQLTVDGVPGPLTRHALGRYGGRLLGKRILRRGRKGWDVAQLQFELAWHGFPSGAFDGIFGPRVDRALRRYQEWAGLGADGLAGPATLGALTVPPPRPVLPL